MGLRVPAGWWVAAALVAFVTAVSWLTVETRRGGGLVELAPTYSTTSSGPGGTRALFLSLDEAGRRPLRLRTPWTELPEGLRILVVPPPLLDISPDEWEAVDRWVRAGGLLIFAPPRWDQEAVDPDPSWSLVEVPEAPGLLEGVRQVGVHLQVTPRQTLPEGGAPRRLARDAVSLLRDGERPLLSWADRDRGAVVILHDPELFSNGGLLRGDNARLVQNLLAGAPPGGIGFDEYHLGHGAGEAGALWRRLAPAVRSGLLHFGVALALLGWALSRRRGAVVAEAPRPRQRSEYLDSMASLLRRAGAWRLVLRLRRHAFDEGLDRALKLPPGASEAERMSALRERDPVLAREGEELVRRMEHLSTGPQPSADTLVALARREADLLEKVSRAP